MFCYIKVGKLSQHACDIFRASGVSDYWKSH